MAGAGRCRMNLKSGERCSYRTLKKGLCGVHARAIREKKSSIEGLLKAGKYAGAVVSLIKLLEEVKPIFHYLQHLAEVGRQLVARKRAGRRGDRKRTPRQELTDMKRTGNYRRLPEVSRVAFRKVGTLV